MYGLFRHFLIFAISPTYMANAGDSPQKFPDNHKRSKCTRPAKVISTRKIAGDGISQIGPQQRQGDGKLDRNSV
jgi:hypothetical protein